MLFKNSGKLSSSIASSTEPILPTCGPLCDEEFPRRFRSFE